MEKRMKMTNAEINDAVNTLTSVINAMSKNGIGHSIELSYIIGRNLRILRNENFDFNSEKEKLIRKYGTFQTDEEGSTYYKVDKKDLQQYKAFEEEFVKLANIEHEIVLYCITPQKMQEMNLPFEIESVLWFLLDESELNL